MPSNCNGRRQQDQKSKAKKIEQELIQSEKRDQPITTGTPWKVGHYILLPTLSRYDGLHLMDKS